MRQIVIGLLGAGTVGSGVVRILEDNKELERRLGAKVVLKRILVREPLRERTVAIPSEILTTRAEDVLDDPDIRVVVELIGGVDPARAYTLAALRAGKHVVTANKALMAIHGREMFAEAARQGVAINFEASVGGGIPILRSLREGLASDRIEQITGIVNGTCNYILDAMTRTGARYDDALRQAQAAGFAEADPTLDVGGGDAAQKLCLLALLGFGERVDPYAIPTEGITRVRAFDIAAAKRFGFVIKSLAMATRTDLGPVLRVVSAFVPQTSVLAGVHGSYNAVLVESRALGRSLYYGRGAGMMPTAMAVVSDIIELCRNVFTHDVVRPPPQAFANVEDVTPQPMAEMSHENYLCVHVKNVPGVLGRVAGCLGDHGVSVRQVRQELPTPGGAVEMIIMTEAASDARVDAALGTIDRFEDVIEPTHRFRVVDPDPLESP